MRIPQNQKKVARMKELIWYICENYNHRLYETKLWKMTFFCDSDYYQKYKKSISEVSYIKNKQGPTPIYEIAKNAIDELIKYKYVKKTDIGYVAIKDYKIKNLGPQETDAINSTCDKYYQLNVNQICTLAHRDPVYLSAEKMNDILDFNFVNYRDEDTEDTEDLSGLEKKVSFSKEAQNNLLKALTI